MEYEMVNEEGWGFIKKQCIRGDGETKPKPIKKKSKKRTKPK